jgi:hypothetical protein
VRSSFRNAVLANTFALLAASQSGRADHVLGTEQTLSIHLYNQAQAPSGVLRLATEEAARLLRSAGIRTSWEQPSAEAPEDHGTNMTSAELWQRDDRPYLVVRLIRAPPPATLPGALGYALPFASTGAHVSIFYDRLKTLSAAPTAPTYVILGHAIAHEIGHVLLRSSAHSAGGLMQAQWNAATWRLAAAGLLAFRHEEAKRICAGLQRFEVRNEIRDH